MPLIHMKKHSS